MLLPTNTTAAQISMCWTKIITKTLVGITGVQTTYVHGANIDNCL